MRSYKTTALNACENIKNRTFIYKDINKFLQKLFVNKKI